MFALRTINRYRAICRMGKSASNRMRTVIPVLDFGICDNAAQMRAAVRQSILRTTRFLMRLTACSLTPASLANSFCVVFRSARRRRSADITTSSLWIRDRCMDINGEN